MQEYRFEPTGFYKRWRDKTGPMDGRNPRDRTLLVIGLLEVMISEDVVYPKAILVSHVQSWFSAREAGSRVDNRRTGDRPRGTTGVRRLGASEHLAH